MISIVGLLMVTILGVVIFAISYTGIEFSYHTEENIN